MVITRGQAVSLCRKLCEDRSCVRVLFETRTVGGFVTGEIAEVSEDAMRFRMPDAPEGGIPSSFLNIPLLPGCSFDFRDPREFVSEYESLEAIESVVMIEFLSGERCFILELANPA
jgi:hypothetical protein